MSRGFWSATSSRFPALAESDVRVDGTEELSKLTAQSGSAQPADERVSLSAARYAGKAPFSLARFLFTIFPRQVGPCLGHDLLRLPRC